MMRYAKPITGKVTRESILKRCLKIDDKTATGHFIANYLRSNIDEIEDTLDDYNQE